MHRQQPAKPVVGALDDNLNVRPLTVKPAESERYTSLTLFIEASSDNDPQEFYLATNFGLIYRMARESVMIFSRHDESSEIGIM